MEHKVQTKKQNKRKFEIKKGDNIAEIVYKHPEAAEVFAAFGLHCSTCFASQFDTVEQGAQIHGMMEDEVEEMIEEANKVINKEENYE